MQPISQKPTSQKPPLRFGSAGGLGGITGAVDTFFQAFQNSRGKEMIAEDVVGFGVFRTGIDLGRGKLAGADDSWNVPAGAERFFREITSILTDSILGGVVAWGMGKAIFDRKNKAFSNTFMQYSSLELFQDIVQSERLKNAQTPEAAKTAFIDELYERLEKQASDPAFAKKSLEEAWDYQRQSHTGIKKVTSWFHKSPNQDQFDIKAKNLVSKLNPQASDFSLNIRSGKKPVSFEMNELLDDISQFANHMKAAWKTRASGEGWKDLAEAGIKRTLTAKNWKIPVGLAAGMGATFAMPFLSNALTKKAFGIDYFPGEIGFNKNLTGKPQNSAISTQKQSWLERHFPYVNKATKDGNPLPLIISAVPLIAAVGLLSAKGKPTNIFAGNGGTLKKMFDFTKAGPFTSAQQMASMFALLITSRLLCSRSDNEYKERLFDSAGGWAFWILGTPLIKTLAAKLSGHKELLTADGEFKSREAIQHFAPKALKANVLIGAGSTLATMGIIGIGAPLLGIKWTQWNETKKQKKLAQQQKQATPKTFQSTLPAMQPNRFAAPSNLFNPAQPALGSFAWQPPQANRQA